ncbi:MAG: hypothetical protein ACK505_12590 [Flavobacteriales bacterium]|jgi:hypothetical protein
MSAEKKQTAVKWLFEQYVARAGLITIEDIEKALAMEREQIIDAWIATDNELQRMSAEQYYTEIYDK